MIKATFFLFCKILKFSGYCGKLIFLFILLMAPSSHKEHGSSSRNLNLIGSTRYTIVEVYSQSEKHLLTSASTDVLTNNQASNTMFTTVGGLRADTVETITDSILPTTDLKISSATLSDSTFSTGTIPISYIKQSEKLSTSDFTCEKLPIKESEQRCPNDLIQLDSDHCYKLIENVSYYTECPYNNYIPYDKFSYHTIFSKVNFNTTSIWIRATRNLTKSCFDHFQWTEYGDSFGNILSISTNNCSLGCITRQNGILKATSCYEKHNHLCIYCLNDYRDDKQNFCTRNFRNDYCTLSSYGYYENSTCYCMMNEFDNSCQMLAEPKEPFQTQILLKRFNGKDNRCLFGLEKQQQDQFVWKSSKDPLNYSYWLDMKDCTNNNSVFKFKEVGWSLEEDKSINCFICELSVPKANVELQLKYLDTVNTLYLFISNILQITNSYNSTHYYCFTDASEKNFYQKITPDYAGDQVSKLKIPNLAKYPSRYWCKALQFPDHQVIESNTIVAYDRSQEYGYNYAIYISINTSDLDFVRNDEHIEMCKLLLEDIQLKSNNLVLSLRPIEIVEDPGKDSQLKLLFHLTTVKTSSSKAEEFKLISDILQSSSAVIDGSISEFFNSEVCLSTTSSSLDNQTLVWPEARIGTTVVPSNLLCLDKKNNLKPVIRKCVGSIKEGAQWLKPEGNCYSDDSEYSETTKELFELMNEAQIDEEDIVQVLRITENNGEQISADVYFIASIIKKVPEDGNKTAVYKIVNNIMNYERSVLKDAQNMLNATDDILYTLDTWLYKETQTNVTLPNIIFRIVNLNEVIGMSLHKIDNATNSFESYDLVPWSNGTSLENVPKETLEAAVLFSNETIDEINTSAKRNVSLKLIVLMFYTNALFNEPETNGTEKLIKNKIVTILIPGFNFDDYLEHPIKIIYKWLNSTEKMCSFWRYGWDDLMVSTQGRWDEKGNSPDNYTKFDVCNCFHLTHFGLLLGGKDFNAKRKFILKLVTSIGLGLSMAGILPIFVTFAMFKIWRGRSNNIILINFCFVITFQTVVMVATGSINEDGVVCKVTGALLYYLVLSEFFWMFSIALLQYRRFVHVLKPPFKNVVVKCCIIGWVLPLFPVFILAFISTDNYGISENKFCYIIGTNTILFGLYLPIVIILIANVHIIIMIFMSISEASLTTAVKTKTNTYKLKIYLGLLLFFILGLAWIFGLLGIFTNEITFTYLFCATATLRGVILFLYFIVMNNESVVMWKRRFQYYQFYLHTSAYEMSNN